MSILEKARELADAIADSEELKALRSAETRMTLDPEAQDIIKEFQEKQQEFYQVQMSGGELNEAQKVDVQRIEGRMSGNEFIRNFVNAQQKFEELLKSVNMIIAQAISGENGAGCGCGDDGEADCGPNCGGCN